MARARRQPPLFEVLHEPARRGGSALSPGTGLRPVQVTPSGRRREPEPLAAEPIAELPAAEVDGAPPESAAASETPWWAGEWGFGGQKGILLAIAVAILVFTLGWVIAFRKGEQHAASKLNLGGAEPVAPVIDDPMLDGGAAQARTTPQPTTREGTSGTTQRQPAVTGPNEGGARPGASTPVATWTPGVDPRQPAHNYLVVATVPFRDAEAMVQFLTENGVPAGAAPASEKVDPKRAMANNDAHVVFPLMAVPSGRFSAMKADRDALQARVEQIGKLWKQAGGGADFSGAIWSRYK